VRRLPFALLSLMLFLFAQPVFATTYYVGSCMPGAFGTIDGALLTVPAGSTIDVCPGTYPEQIVISEELTLQGITSGNSSSVVITLPTGGLIPTSSITFEDITFFAQVEVTAGPVVINNITVDGSATSSTSCPNGPYAGIFYASGSSGTLNNVNTRHQSCYTNASTGVGILAENGDGTTQSITIENSNVRDQTYSGILACSRQTNPSSLTVSIKDNNVDEFTASDGTGILLECNVAASVSGNIVDATADAVLDSSPSATISGNTVLGEGSGQTRGIFVVGNNVVVSHNTVLKTYIGIEVAGTGDTASSNQASDNTYGIYLLSPNVSPNISVTNNVITRNNIGIEFACRTPLTLTGNVIDTATTGMDMVPALFSGANSFYNTSIIRTGGC
jgi:hypothetical protein